MSAPLEYAGDRSYKPVASDDERGERNRKSFSGTTKAEVSKKMTDYVAAFDSSIR